LAYPLTKTKTMSKRKNLERPVAVGEVLGGLIRPGDWQALEVRQRVRAVWEQTVPRRLREQCRLQDLKRQELWVEAGSSALVQELQFLRPKILAALEKALGAGVIKEVRFQVGAGA
jgi:predicted nucleic acid-binding Zn ribbon protein